MPGAPEPEPAAYGDEPLRYGAADGAPEVLQSLCRRLPADLVNQLELDGPLDASASARPEPPAASTGWWRGSRRPSSWVCVDQDLWWERRGQSAESWDAELQSFVLLNQPIRRVPDALIWKRWDAGTDRAKAMVAVEILKRPNLSDDAGAVAEMAQRPDLLNEVLEAGIKGRRATDREAAARWVAAAGTDEQVVDLAVELLHVDSGPLALPLLNRLQQQPPDRLPGPIAATVAANLDGAYPFAPFWADHCLRLLLAAQPTCAHPEQLVEAVGDDVLEGAVSRAAARRGRPRGLLGATGLNPPAAAGPDLRRGRPRTGRLPADPRTRPQRTSPRPEPSSRSGRGSAARSAGRSGRVRCRLS